MDITEHPPNFDFGFPQPDRSPVTIRPTRPMLLRDTTGTMQHTPAGSEITVERHTLAMLIVGDYDLAAGRSTSRAREARRQCLMVPLCDHLFCSTSRAREARRQ